MLTELDRGGYHLFINLKVNGKKCRFLIDTGASHSVIDKAWFEKNIGKKKLTVIKQQTTGLHSSIPETYLGNIKEITAGKWGIKNFTVAAVDLNHVNQTYKQLKQPKIQGILGSDVMVLSKAVIDYGKEKIYLQA